MNMAPTLTLFAAPTGGAASLGAALRESGMAPTLTLFAATTGGAASLGAAVRES
jgi:hypothetical protein